jgi:precorrin-3B C17-methyltransferase
MEGKIKIAVTPQIQVGGSLFTPEQLGKLGAIADSDSRIEMTSFKQLYMEIPSLRREEVTVALEHARLEVYPAGFVTKSLIACQFCKGAEEAGLETARLLNRAIAGIETPTPLKVGYAGCALGTSEPLLKDISVVKMREAFDIYVGGEPKGIKASIAQLIVSNVSLEKLIPIVTAIIHYYIANAKGKEKFSKFLNRITLEKLKQATVD